MSEITRNGFVNKNGDKVVLKPAPVSATAGNLAEFGEDGRVKDSGVSKNNIGAALAPDTTPTAGSEKLITSGGVYTALASIREQSEAPELYIYQQNRSGYMVYVSHNGTQAYYKFGSFTFIYIKQDGTRETLNNKNLNEFADKMPAGVNILLPIAVYETVADAGENKYATILPAIFMQASDKSWARFYIGNICFKFFNTPVNGVPQYTIDNDGFCTGVGNIYDLTHIFSSDTTYAYKYNPLTTGTLAQAGGGITNGYTFTPGSGESSLYSQVKIGDILKIKNIASNSEIEVEVVYEGTTNGVQHVRFADSIASFYLGTLCQISKNVPDDNFSKFTNKADKTTHHLLNLLNYTSLEEKVKLAVVFGEEGVGDQHYILKNNSANAVTIADFFSTTGTSMLYSDGISSSTSIPANGWLAVAIRKVNGADINLYMLIEGYSSDFLSDDES